MTIVLKKVIQLVQSTVLYKWYIHSQMHWLWEALFPIQYLFVAALHKINKNILLDCKSISTRATRDLSGLVSYMYVFPSLPLQSQTVSNPVGNTAKVTQAKTSLQIASLQNHFNFLCVALHWGRSCESWACWPDDKARPLPDATVNKHTGSKRCSHQAATINAWCSQRTCPLYLNGRVSKQMTRLNIENCSANKFDWALTWGWLNVRT